MGKYPKQLHVRNDDDELWRNGLVEVHVVAIVPFGEAQGLLNELGQIL